jgi:DNA ligase (NAD+)
MPAKKTDPKTRILALRKEIAAHKRRYYEKNAPSISDFAFDQLLKELQALEAAHPEFADPKSPTQKVGGETSKGF